MPLRDPDKTFIKVNKALGKIPSIGPVPANQILPWISILIASWVLTMELFNLGLVVFFALSIWLIATWWLLTGRRAYHFLDRFKSPPNTDWITGYAHYTSLLHRSTRCRTQRSPKARK